MILGSIYIAIPLAMLLVLGFNMLIFGVAVVVPSIAFVQAAITKIVYLQTANAEQAVDASLYVSLVVAGLWIIGFVIRYGRGEKLESLIPMPEYAKIMLLSASILMLAFTNMEYIMENVYYVIINFVVSPLVNTLGVLQSIIVAPLALLIYVLLSQYIVRSIEKMRGNVFMIGAVSSVTMAALSTVTIVISTELLDSIYEYAAEEYGYIAPFISIAIVLLALFSLRELRRAFVELRPEAIIQLPAILGVLRPFLGFVLPDLVIAIDLLVSGLTIAMIAAMAIAGVGLGSRRLVVAGAGIVSSLMSVSLTATGEVLPEIPTPSPYEFPPLPF